MGKVGHLSKVVNKSQSRLDTLQTAVHANKRDVQDHGGLIAPLTDKLTEMDNF